MKCMDAANVMRFYAGQVSPEDEEDINNHLSRCDKCASLRAEIETTVKRLAPDDGEFHDPDFTDEVMTLIRLGRAPREAEARTRTPFWKHWQTWLLVPATAAATAALFFVVAPQRLHKDTTEFQVRGTLTKNPDRWVSLQAFHVTDQGYRPVRRDVFADDTLAFTYQNRPPSQFRYLIVIAIDDRGEVYWYYPAHVDNAKNPSSIEIDHDEEPIQLPEQVKHELAIGPLRIFGLFSSAPLDVGAVEQKVTSHLAQVGAIVELHRIEIENTGQHSLLLNVIKPSNAKGE